MKPSAEDLRNHVSNQFKLITAGFEKPGDTFHSADVSTKMQIMLMLGEIAALLAELVELERTRTSPPVPSRAERDIIS